MFYGDHEHTLDDKGRVAIPAKFREQLGERVWLTRGFDGNLLGFSDTRWQQLAQDLDKLSIADPNSRELRRQIFGSASECEPDKQGRIVVPQPLRTSAKLSGTAVFAGIGSYFEIWSVDGWAARTASFDVNASNLAQYLGPLGL